MLLSSRNFSLTLAAVLLLLASAGEATAQGVIVSRYYPPTVAYYYPAPTVSYYVTPTITTYSPPVAYYPVPSVSYYAPPVLAYYYPAPVTTVRYGLFGRPRVITTYYPGYVLP